MMYVTYFFIEINFEIVLHWYAYIEDLELVEYGLIFICLIGSDVPGSIVGV